ncbi:unnamed protein product [Urochloa decumbens]|uniref:Transmembrane protein n=1 Tax=Urochloa decumbens TaxID=240449 RepID=A0ABC8V946_9POAL
MLSSLTYPCLLRDHFKQSHHSSMFSLSSTQALRGQLIKPSTTTAVILVVMCIFTLCITSCEARRLRVHGNKDSSSSNLPSSPPKGVDASTGDEAVTGAKKKEVASSGDSYRGSMRKRHEGMKVRSSLREKSMLGAESNSEQVGSNTTTAYTPETLVAMDYLDAHPAPAVHNR